MARQAVNVTVVANPVHPSQHGVVPTAAGAETADVYVSYNAAKIIGYSQLHSALMAALGGIVNGNFAVNT